MGKHDQKADLYPYRCYRVDETLYIPHYKERYWVGPGYPLATTRVYTNMELINMGAKQEVHLLWKRNEHTEVRPHE
jgi:hypothetical protein